MILLNLIDLATTLYITSHGGIELNPLMAWLIAHELFLWVKLIVGTACCLWLEWRSKYYHSARVGKWVVTVMYMFIVGNNLWTILILRM